MRVLIQRKTLTTEPNHKVKAFIQTMSVSFCKIIPQLSLWLVVLRHLRFDKILCWTNSLQFVFNTKTLRENYEVWLSPILNLYFDIHNTIFTKASIFCRTQHTLTMIKTMLKGFFSVQLARLCVGLLRMDINYFYLQLVILRRICPTQYEFRFCLSSCGSLDRFQSQIFKICCQNVIRKWAKM